LLDLDKTFIFSKALEIRKPFISSLGPKLQQGSHYVRWASHVNYGRAFLHIDLYTPLDQQKPEELTFLLIEYTLFGLSLS